MVKRWLLRHSLIHKGHRFDSHVGRPMVANKKKNILILFCIHHYNVIFFLDFTRRPKILRGWQLSLAQLGNHSLIYKGLKIERLGDNVLVVRALGVRV
jgi:hypothetical protein